MKNRKPRIDSAGEAVRIMAAATRIIEPPSNVPLDDQDMPFFSSVLSEAAKTEWTAHSLEVAALLARAMRDLEREQIELRREGSTITNPNGNIVQNPRVRNVSVLSGFILAARRSLSIHARAAAGEARDVAARRKAAANIEADNPLDDDLLARPN